jgi:phosphate transport system permease protein
MAIREDHGFLRSFGAVPAFAGTALISLIAMVIAGPSACFRLSTWPNTHILDSVPFLPLLGLAGVPTVVYGFFAALTIGPALRGWGEGLGLDVASESALAAGFVMGIMIIPFVSSLADDMISAVPQSLRDGAYALGATRSETIRQVVLRAALPGIVGGVLLAVSRAIGETMIVVSRPGLRESHRQPTRSRHHRDRSDRHAAGATRNSTARRRLAAFALGLVLFLVTLALNVLALHIVRKYREQYE